MDGLSAAEADILRQLLSNSASGSFAAVSEQDDITLIVVDVLELTRHPIQSHQTVVWREMSGANARGRASAQPSQSRPSRAAVRTLSLRGRLAWRVAPRPG
jgi:hypothetical protein